MLATSLCRTHKHEDNLSFTLFFDGLEWLIDPSFYSHEYSAPVPAYLRSASAHNALVLPKQEYSIDPGKTGLVGNEQGDSFVFRGQHDAYDNVQIKRKIKGEMDSLDFRVTDRATGQIGEAELRLMIHCGEQVKASIDGNNLHLSHPDSKYILAIKLPTKQCQIYHGQDEGNTIRGISGLSFMELTNIDTIECKVPSNSKLKWSVKAIKA